MERLHAKGRSPFSSRLVRIVAVMASISAGCSGAGTGPADLAPPASGATGGVSTMVCTAGASCTFQAAAADPVPRNASSSTPPASTAFGPTTARPTVSSDAGTQVGAGLASSALTTHSVSSAVQVSSTVLGANSVSGAASQQSVTVSTVRRWSDPGTWGGSLPAAGAAVVVPAGVRVLLDRSPPALGVVTVRGELEIEPGAAVNLAAAALVVTSGGTFRAGTSQERFTGRLTVTLTGDVVGETDPRGTRGIQVVDGGKLLLYGTPPTTAWTRLNAHADSGARQLSLDQQVDWKSGDNVVIAPTEWYPNPWADQVTQNSWTTTELRVLDGNAIGGNLTLTTGLTSFRWGRLQYATDNGMSLVRTAFTPPTSDAADVLDERAEVGNLTRNIVIQGADDAQWRDQGFGAHVMVMDRASQLQMDGVELRRMGQAGKVGRYPIHWHLLSYSQDGSLLGDAVGHYVRNSTIWNSRQRCIVIHGTNGIELTNNICFDIRGHAIFLEDAVERRNVIQGNLVLKVRAPTANQLIAEHERFGQACGGSSGYWLTNPDNTVVRNVAADAQGNGFWLSYPARPVKQNALVPIQPRFLPHAPFSDNVAHSNGNAGVLLDCAMTDDAGNVAPIFYAPTSNGLADDGTNGTRFTINNITTAKNRTGYINRATYPDYVRWVAADNVSRAFTGAVNATSTLSRSLIVGRSLNNRQPQPNGAEPALGVSSYNSTLDITLNTFVGFTNAGYTLTGVGHDLPSGTFGTDDYYIRPVELGMVRNVGNRLVQADPGYRAIPTQMQAGYTAANRLNYTLAGAIWDPNGYWSAPGRYWVLDHPFLRDSSCTTVLTTIPSGRPNGLSCAGPYFGVGNFLLNRGLPGATTPYLFYETLEATKVDASGNEVGRWRVEEGYDSYMLGQMRHFAAVQGGTYILRFPEFPYASTSKYAPRWVQFDASAFTQPGHAVLLGVHYDGAVAPSRVIYSTNPDYPWFGRDSRLLTQAGTRVEVAAGDGSRYWRDSANNLVWIKLTPLGLNAWPGIVARSDPDLYRTYSVRIEP